MRRVTVVGNSGSGKTTLGRRLAARLGVPFVELDGIYHQPNWKGLPDAEFRDRVGRIVAGDAWVIDGNYSEVRDLVWARADTVVWFDLPRRTVLRQVFLRTLRRAVTQEELWNGNRETWSGVFGWDPEISIIRWAWTRHDVYRQRYVAAATDPELSHLTFVRIGGHADSQRLLDTDLGVGGGPVPGRDHLSGDPGRDLANGAS